jgi:hypothetical protein
MLVKSAESPDFRVIRPDYPSSSGVVGFASLYPATTNPSIQGGRGYAESPSEIKGARLILLHFVFQGDAA